MNQTWVLVMFVDPWVEARAAGVIFCRLVWTEVEKMEMSRYRMMLQIWCERRVAL